jgi:imidazolonepropionase-like amidohydrolase
LWIPFFSRILDSLNALIVFQNITLIDGTGREPLPEATVAVREHQIIYAGKAKRWQPSLEEDILNLDFSGKYLLPGLIDCHVHLAGSGEPDGRFHADDGAMALRMLNNARKNLAAGITTVRDCGGWNELEFAVRAAVQRGEFTGPRLLLAGRFLSTSESGATQYPGMYRIARGVEGVRKAVREQIRHGADLVKMGVTGAVLIEDDAAGDTHFNSEEIGGAVAEAAKSDRRVAAHAHGIEGIRKAVFAGAHSIEHGTYLHEGPDVIEEMRRRGTFLVPTLKAPRDVVKGDASKLPAWMLDKTREAQEAARKSIRLAYHAGVPIAMGSDASSPFNYHGENGLEVDCMRQAGIKPMDALVSSTLTAAKALGLDSQVGSIEEGKRADLLILDANPLEDLKRLADKKLIRAVFQDGKLVARQPGDVYPRTILARDSLTVGP